MKMIFKVANNRDSSNPHSHINEPRMGEEQPNNSVEVDIDTAIKSDTNEISTTTTTEQSPLIRYNSKVPSLRGGEYIYYYHPRDLIELENNSIYQKKRNSRNRYENEVWKNEALRFTSSSNSMSINVSLVTGVMIILSILR